MSRTQKEQHKEETRIYRECKNVEKVLMHHIQNASEGNFIKHMVDEDTGLIKQNIPTVL